MEDNEKHTSELDSDVSQKERINRTPIIDKADLDRYQSIALELSKALEAQTQGIQEALRELPSPTSQLGSLRVSFNTDAQIRSIANITKGLDKQGLNLAEAIGSLSRRNANMLRDLIPSQSDQLKQFASFSAELSTLFRSSNARALSEALRHNYDYSISEVESENDGELTPSALEFIWLWVIRTLADAKITIDPNLVLTLIVMIVLHFHALESSPSRDDIVDLGDRIELALALSESPVTENEGGQRFVTQGRLNLRSEPSTTAQVILTMGINQVVEVSREDGNWCYVSFEDHVDNVPRHGWVHRDYLKAVEE